MFEIRNQVFRLFQADRNARETRRNATGIFLVARNDPCDWIAQAGGIKDQPDVPAQALMDGICFPFDAQHTAEPFQRTRFRMPVPRRQTAIAHLSNRRMRLEKLGNHLGGTAMLVHPQGKRLHALRNEESIHRPEQTAEPVLRMFDPTNEFLFAGNNSTRGVAVAAHVLRYAVNHQVGAKTGRLQQVGGNQVLSTNTIAPASLVILIKAGVSSTSIVGFT